MPRRHYIDLRVVEEAVVLDVERSIRHAVRQDFAPAPEVLAGLRVDEIIHAFALDRLAVDMQHAVDHLDAVARQPDETLDVVGGAVLRQTEHHHVAALRFGGENTSGKPSRRTRERIVGVAVSVFRHEKMVADEERRLHRSTRNVEGLEQECPDQDYEYQCRQDHDRTFLNRHARACRGHPRFAFEGRRRKAWIAPDQVRGGLRTSRGVHLEYGRCTGAMTAHRAAKIAFGIMPWMPLVPSTTWVT